MIAHGCSRRVIRLAASRRARTGTGAIPSTAWTALVIEIATGSVQIRAGRMVEASCDGPDRIARVGSPAIASLIAHAAFWGLLVYGFVLGELPLKGLLTFVVMWIAARVGLPHAPYEPARSMFSPFVAILDIALVFAVFKGDVRIT